jgi:hypothetical protein
MSTKQYRSTFTRFKHWQMECFTKELYLNNVRFQVSFYEVCVPGGKKFFVSAISREGNSYAFEMKKIDGKWLIVNAPKLPGLLMDSNGKLSAIIEECLKQ